MDSSNKYIGLSAVISQVMKVAGAARNFVLFREGLWRNKGRRFYNELRDEVKKLFKKDFSGIYR